MPMTATDIEQHIKTALPDATVIVRDLAGDGDHYEVKVVSASFAGKPRVIQHKMVYDALGGKVGGVLHALAVKTEVPA